MPLSNTYYDTLKTQLEAAANSKKAAIDAALLRSSTAQFDPTTGKVTGYGPQGPGTLDVQEQENVRALGTSSEGAGMLRSGQYARQLAGSQAAYRSAVAETKAKAESEKTQIDTDTAAELAKYKAMYEVPGASGGNSSNTAAQPTAPKTPSSPAIAPPPVFKPSTPAPSASAGNFRMFEEKLSAQPVPAPPKPAPPKNPAKPAPPKPAPAPKVSNTKLKNIK